jgi:hypothetical protein
LNARFLVWLSAALLLACGGRSRYRENDEPNGALDCRGALQNRTIELVAPAEATLASPTAAPSELELFYVQYDRPYEGHFRRAQRPDRSAPFTDTEALPELDAACARADYRSIELTPDGLRAYVLCFATLDEGAEGALRVADRARANERFTLRAKEYGRVGASPAITPNELTLYTSYPAGAGEGPPFTYTRASTDEPFSAGTKVPGLGDSEMASPDPSPDGLSLFGGVSTSITVATRTRVTDEFGSPVPVVSPADGTQLLGAPDLTPNCRSLYFVAVYAGVAPPIYQIERLER